MEGIKLAMKSVQFKNTLENGHSYEWKEDHRTVFLKLMDFNKIAWVIAGPLLYKLWQKQLK